MNMFWSKKSDFWTKETTKESFGVFCGLKGVTLCEPMHRNTKLAELGDIEDLEEEVKALSELSRLIEQKLDLILDHLNLTYQPETEKKEPAKLVEKPDWNTVISGLDLGCVTSGSPFRCSVIEETPVKSKSKLKYTKRNKSKK